MKHYKVDGREVNGDWYLRNYYRMEGQKGGADEGR